MPVKRTIGFLTGDWSWGTNPLQVNGCAWYRCSLPIAELTKFQWVCGLGFPGFTHEKGFGIIHGDKKIIQGWDIIVFKLLMQSSVLEFLPRAKELGQTIVVDVDDFFDGLHSSNQAFSVTDPTKNKNENRDIYNKIILEADAVITSTPFLFDYYSKLRNNVYLIRNGIDVDRFSLRVRRMHARTTIGWVGATSWRSHDLEQINSWFPDYMKSRNLRFHHSGHVQHSRPAHHLLGLRDDICTTLPLCPISEYPSLFKPIDIGIVPLNDIPFNHAKSYIKGLEYAASGIPFVSSYSPEYQYLADQGIGRIAKTEDEWIYHLDELRVESIRKDEIIHNAERLKDFTMEKEGTNWNDVMREILDNL